MSGQGAPALQQVDAAALRVAVVASCWHEPVMDALIEGARRALVSAGISHPPVVRVPGSYELPVMAAHLARSGADAVVALGLVLRGDTPHFDYVCQAVSDGLMQVSLSNGVPVGFGLLTCDTIAQAWARAGLPDSAEDKGGEAAAAAVHTALAMREAEDVWANPRPAECGR